MDNAAAPKPAAASKPMSPSKRAEASDVAYGEKTDECVICLDVMEQPLQTPCRHLFCGGCIEEYLETNPVCPTCRARANVGNLKKPKKKGGAKKTPKETVAVELPPKHLGEGTVVFDAKVKVLMGHIKKLRKEKPGEKVLVFTQYAECAKWIGRELDGNGFKHRTLHGVMSMWGGRNYFNGSESCFSHGTPHEPCSRETS